MAGLTVVKNPFVPHDGRAVYEKCPESTVGEIVDAYIPEGMGWRVFVDGKEVTDRTKVLHEGQEVTVCAVVAGGGGKEGQKTMLRTVALLVVTVVATVYGGPLGTALGLKGNLAVGVGTALIMTGGSLLVNAILPMPTPNAELGGAFSLDDSNTYGWEQSRNQINEGLAVPVLYGTFRVTPQVIGRYRTTTGTSEELNMLMLISDGKIDSITEVKANDVFVDSIPRATVRTRLGEVNQTVVQGFQDTVFEKIVNAELTTAITVTTEGNSVEGLGVGIVFPQGLYTFADGGYGGLTVRIRLEWSVAGAGVWNLFSVMGDAGHDATQTQVGTSSIGFGGGKINTVSKPWSDIVNPTLLSDPDDQEYCMEAWIRPAIVDEQRVIMGLYNIAGTPVFQLYILDGELKFQKFIEGGSTETFTATDTIPVDTWTHVAVSRYYDGVNYTLFMFVNGAISYQFNDDGKYMRAYYYNTPDDGIHSLSVGSNLFGTGQFFGHMDLIRVTFGEPIYNFAFMPPSADLTAGANTELLIQSKDTDTGSVFTDESGQNTLNYAVEDEDSIGITFSQAVAYRKYFRDTTVLAPGSYDVRATLIDDGGENDSTTVRMNDIYFEYVHEITLDDFTYPGTALVAINAVASEEIYGSQPAVTCLATRSTVPQYATTWGTGTPTDRPADNPAWACYDMLVNPLYGMGVSLDRIEIGDFIAWASFCTNADYKCNIYLDRTQSLHDALGNISQVGRGCVVQRGTTFGVIWDSVGTRVHLYTPGNIITDSYTMQYLDMESRANMVEVTYFDEDLDYERKVVTILGDNTADQSVERKSSIVLYGCTSRAQAAKHGKYMLNSNKYLRRVISFDADIDSIVCEVGDIIGFAHDVPRYGEGGRVVSATSTTAELSRTVNFETGKTYAVIVKDPSDNALYTHAVSNPGTMTTASITLDTGTWTVTPDEHWVFSFGETDLEVKDYRVTGISRSGELRATITAVEYRAEVYVDDITIPDYEQESNLPDLTTLVLDDIYEAQPDGSWVGKIYATWRGYTTHWMYSVRDSAGSLIKSGSTDRRELLVSGVTEGETYTVTVQAPYGGTTLIDSVTMTIDPPDAPSYVSVSTVGQVVTLKWPIPASEISIGRYEILKGTEIIGKVDTTNFTFTELLAGNYTYSVRAVDTAGRVGTATSVTAFVSPEGSYIDIASFEYTGGATLTQTTVDTDGTILVPAETATWEEWWDEVYPTGTPTWQTFIDDGYTAYLAPSTAVTGTVEIEESFDVGRVLEGGIIDVSYATTVVYGNENGLTVEPTISYSTDDITYTDTTGVFQVFANNFRYVKIKLTFVRADNNALYFVDPTIKVKGEAIDIVTTTPYSVDAFNRTIECDCSSNNILLNLPTAVGNEGLEYIIVKTDSTSKVVVIKPSGSELIKGNVSLTINFQWSSVHIYSNGANWLTK